MMDNNTKNFLLCVITALAFIAFVETVDAATPIPQPSAAIVQPKGPAKAWQLIFDNSKFSMSVPPATLGFYADLASCERVKSQVWDADPRRQPYVKLSCVEVLLP